MDMIRLLWGVLFTVLLFIQPEVRLIDYIFNAISITVLLSQAFHALRSLNFGKFKNDYKVHRSYLYSKIIYLFSNCIKLSFENKKDCSSDQDIKGCLGSDTNVKFCIDLVWTLFECYFCIIIYSFCCKIFNGMYGPVGGTPIFPGDIDDIEIGCYKFAKIMEVSGVKIKNAGGDMKIEEGKPVYSEKKKNYSERYFKIFPLPLLGRNKINSFNKKKIQLRDLTTIKVFI